MSEAVIETRLVFHGIPVRQTEHHVLYDQRSHTQVGLTPLQPYRQEVQ